MVVESPSPQLDIQTINSYHIELHASKSSLKFFMARPSIKIDAWKTILSFLDGPFLQGHVTLLSQTHGSGEGNYYWRYTDSSIP